MCHSYHGNILVARGKMDAMGDKIFQNLCFQNFLFLSYVGALIMKVQSNEMCVSIKADIKIHFWLFEDSPLHCQLHLKLKPIHCIFYINVIKVALFAIKSGGFQIDVIDILDIITLL